MTTQKIAVIIGAVTTGIPFEVWQNLGVAIIQLATAVASYYTIEYIKRRRAKK